MNSAVRQLEAMQQDLDQNDYLPALFERLEPPVPR